jgi:hypothetical protein
MHSRPANVATELTRDAATPPCITPLCSMIAAQRVALEIVARTLEPKQICYLEAEFR